METSRRNFLKIGGLCALGLGPSVARCVCQNAGAKFMTIPRPYREEVGHGDRYEEVLGKRASGLQRCILACHAAHNVPDIGTGKEEIKWIWEEKYENVFPARKAVWNPKR